MTHLDIFLTGNNGNKYRTIPATNHAPTGLWLHCVDIYNSKYSVRHRYFGAGLFPLY